MRFRLNKHEDEITLEAFLKAVGANDDYQQIRFMIKDGKVWVNGDKETARRRLLRVGDNVAFEDRYYVLFPHREEYVKRPKKTEKHQRSNPFDEHRKTEKVIHHKKPLEWTEKKVVKKVKSKTDSSKENS